MARYTYGGTSADSVWITIPSSGYRLVGALVSQPVTMWSAATGGTQYTDLLVGGSPATSVTSGANGTLPSFQGPDGIPSMYADAGAGFRILIAAVSAPITGQNPVTGMFHADGYGDRTLKTSNINLAITAAKVAGGAVYVRQGIWTADEVINLSGIGYYDTGTGILSSIVKLVGAGHHLTRIQSTTALNGFGFLEVVGSPRAHVEGIHFEDYNYPTTTLAYGVLTGRNTSGDSVDQMCFRDVWVTGAFSLAGFISYASEQAHYQDITVATVRGPAMVLARDTRGWTVTTKYAGVVTASPFSGGDGVIRMDRVQLTTSRNAANGPADYPLVVEFAQTFTADSMYVVSGGAPLVLLDKAIHQASFRGLQQEFWSTGAVAGATEPVGVYLKNTVTGGESNNMRLTFDASSLYSVLSEDSVKVQQLSVRGSGWRASGKTWTVDLYDADTVDIPSGNSWSAIGTTEDSTPTYRKRNGSTLVVALPHSVLRGSASLDFPSVTASGGTQSLTVTVTGAAVGDDATCHFDTTGVPAGLLADAYVSAANTVTVKVTNATAGAINPAAQTVRVNVFKFA